MNKILPLRSSHTKEEDEDERKKEATTRWRANEREKIKIQETLKA
jgi:hypothetical protein